MKIIEALKKVKDLYRKADDIKSLIAKHHADLDFETPHYADQRAQVQGWIQSYSDLLKEIAKLNFQIQKTNLVTQVSVELEGKHVTKSITEWILRRKKLAALEEQCWKVLNDKGLREGVMPTTAGGNLQAKIRRYYDPSVRDAKLAALSSEPSLIDAKLEIINAVTDLVE